ncbi:hypothetical protein FHS43_004391 [Streptosporangium becharense]|uniref:Uncharacterized protein n=1 Tax=Streptosporangium becharense TaxID=1816182 RepID=A0A7W9IK39_9ACTN|nr:hypothetical protein [Streptosporangium becharense]MBB2913093.1 hypothetical protein [Streptosporangium becharense]MBB5822076.1 hypothetical protein [Streptosporangium becharense]
MTPLIAARESCYLKLKQGPDNRGTIRLQCPAAGSSAAVICPRFNRLHPAPITAPAVVELADARKRAAQTILVSLMACIANLHILTAWRQTTDRRPVPHTAATPVPGQNASLLPPAHSEPPPSDR